MMKRDASDASDADTVSGWSDKCRHQKTIEEDDKKEDYLDNHVIIASLSSTLTPAAANHVLLIHHDTSLTCMM